MLKKKQNKKTPKKHKLTTHTILTGISSAFCPLVLGNGPAVREDGPWEAVVTVAAELGSDNLLSFPEVGCRDNAGSEASSVIQKLARLLSLLKCSPHFGWMHFFFFINSYFINKVDHFIVPG